MLIMYVWWEEIILFNCDDDALNYFDILCVSCLIIILIPVIWGAELSINCIVKDFAYVKNFILKSVHQTYIQYITLNCIFAWKKNCQI